MRKLILNWLFGTDKVDSYIELLHENIETYKQNQELRKRYIEEIEAHMKTLAMTQEIINTLIKLVQVCENHGIDIYEEEKNIKL